MYEELTSKEELLKILNEQQEKISLLEKLVKQPDPEQEQEQDQETDPEPESKDEADEIDKLLDL